MYVLLRNKSVASMKKENKNQQEREQKPKTSNAENNDDKACDDEEVVKPVISTPVSHLWTSEDGVTPLVRPEEATSTGVLCNYPQREYVY